ncbi:MAG: phosphoribosylamine--glycine ligase [Bdellovibrio sp.]|nr:phosphoribosylamine--glycine ligase [Bdellovibrio sp.]
MKALVLGSGGREHALALGLRKSSLISDVYVHPGNAGLFLSGGLSPLFSLSPAHDSKEGVAIRARELNVDLVVIGPENLLAQGYADFLSAQGFKVIGPSQAAAQLESSKGFAKAFMEQYGIPTATYFTTQSQSDAEQFIDKAPFSIVVKADELAQGKGVIVTDSKAEAKAAVWSLLCDKKNFNSEKLVLERRLRGYETSAIALVDGDSFYILGYAQDYKRAFDSDQGPNTGGMGAVLRPNWPGASIQRQSEEIFQKTLDGLKDRGLSYQGFMFLGLMIEDDQVFLLEYNVRSGDPETQVLIPNLKVDLGVLFVHVLEKKLHKLTHNTPEQCFVHVVLASGGYPDIAGRGLNLKHPISIPHDLKTSDQVTVYYAGVGMGGDGRLVNKGGRVLGLTACGRNTQEAREKVYDALTKIKLDGSFYRTDIGQEK